jgi:hypothetical protein
VKTKAASVSDLPRRNRRIRIMGGDDFMIPPVSAQIDIDGERIGAEVRRALETARVATAGALEGAGRVFARAGNRVDW